MDLHAKMLLEEFDELLPTLNKLEEVIKKAFEEHIKPKVKIVNFVETRVKSRNSLIGKLELKGYKYKSIFDLTDLVGGRIITYYYDGIDRVAATISEIFDIDWQNTVDKRDQAEIDRFGYISLHYICRVPERLYKDEKYPELNNISFEIQMRTLLQHAWAAISHDTGYKNDIEVPREILRSISSLAGLLEIADKEFLRIRVVLDEYRQKVKSIVASGNFADAELDIDSFNAYIESGAFNALNKRIAQINNMEIEEMPFAPLLAVLKKMNFNTLEDVENMKVKYSEDAYQFALRQLNDTELDIIASTTGLQDLIIVYVIRKGGGIATIKLLLDYLYGNRTVNERMAKRIMEYAEKAGIRSV